MLGNYKIRVNNESESKEAQELFFELGYFWKIGDIFQEGINYIYSENYHGKRLSFSGTKETFDISENKEINLPQLRDMVSLESNGVNKHTSAYKQVIKYQSEDGTLFDTEQECINYHNERKLVNILEDNIYALRHEDGSEVLDLMKQHKDLFLEYLQNI